MKTEVDPEGKDFEVPLCDRAIAILKAVIPMDAPSDADVFAGQWSMDHSKPLGMNAVLHRASCGLFPVRNWFGSSAIETWT